MIKKSDNSTSSNDSVASEDTVFITKTSGSVATSRIDAQEKNANINSDKTAIEGKAGFKIGDTIKGRFVLNQHLGAGGMGNVYKALDLIQEEAQANNPWVAIKLLDNIEMDAQDALIFLQRETSKARSLSHPNIITVYDVDRDNNIVFMTMEYLDGISLDEWIDKNAPATLQQCLPIWEATASALEYAHHKGLVHCDFKPGNVVISKNNEIKVIDFGIARAKAGASNLENTVLNLNEMGAMTLSYASCEMLEGQAPEPTDDIYALAIVMYKMLTGKHPYRGKNALQARILKVSPEIIKDLDKSVWQKLNAGLSYDRAKRPQHAKQILSGLIDTKIGVSKPLVATVSAALLLVLGYMGIHLSTQEVSQIPKVKPQSNTVPIDYQEPILTPEQANELEIKLATAEAHLLMGFYVLPPTNNAYEAFKDVMVLYPYNKRARAGIKQIADHFLSESKRYKSNNQTEQALNAIQQGLNVMPDHPELLLMQEEYF